MMPVFVTFDPVTRDGGVPVAPALASRGRAAGL